MKNFSLLILTAFFLTSCMKEERELLDDLIIKTKSENVKLSYTLETIPKPRHTIDFDIDKSSMVKDDASANYVAGRTALVVLAKLEESKLEENEAIRIKFTNPDYPNPPSPDKLDYYSFDIGDLRKATQYITRSENIIRGYFNDFILLKDQIDSVQIKRLDSVLTMYVPKTESLRSIEFLKFETLKDSLENHYTAILNSLTTTSGQQNVTILFDNKTGKVVELNSNPF